jgi:hypothetical protein
MPIFPRLYERVTGRPWTTGRTASIDFGPPPGAVHAEELAAYSDAELLSRDLRRPKVGTR